MSKRPRPVRRPHLLRCACGRKPRWSWCYNFMGDVRPEPDPFVAHCRCGTPLIAIMYRSWNKRRAVRGWNRIVRRTLLRRAGKRYVPCPTCASIGWRYRRAEKEGREFSVRDMPVWFRGPDGKCPTCAARFEWECGRLVERSSCMFRVRSIESGAGTATMFVWRQDG